MNSYSDVGQKGKKTRSFSFSRLFLPGLVLLLGCLVITFSVTIMFIQPQLAPVQRPQLVQNPTQTPPNQPAPTRQTGTPTPGATPTPSDPSGQNMPTGDLPGWHQIFADDFTTNVPLGSFPGAVSNKWNDYPDGWRDPTGSGYYYPSRVVSIQNGVMNLYLHTENGVHMTAAPEPILPNPVDNANGLLYGRYVVRFKADPVAGYRTAWLLWPDSEVWPRDGEIDFPEGNLDGSICSYVHHQDATLPHDQDAVCSQTTYAGWHTATLVWTPTVIYSVLDGIIIGTSTTRVPNTPMHWILQTESGTNPPNDATVSNIQIDWVTVYAPTTTAFSSSASLLAGLLNPPPATSSPTTSTARPPAWINPRLAWLQDEEEKGCFL